jgi:hypothetical protein
MKSVLQCITRLGVFALILAAPPLARPGGAQGSRVLITVYQKGTRFNTILPGAAVCFTSTNYTKITDQRGIVIFDNVPAGSWSAVGWKSGFKAKRADIAVPGTATDVRASITLESGTEQSPCILPAPPPPPPITQVDLTVRVVRTDGTPVQHARVCVGTQNGYDLYAYAYETGTSGRAYFTVPKVYSVYVTASAPNMTGASKVVYLPTGVTTVHAEDTLSAGTGGHTCPVH